CGRLVLPQTPKIQKGGQKVRLDDAASYAYHNLRARKLRSWLTILGIIIGVASIITLISLANGVNEQINARLTGLGNNIIQVAPGSAQATRTGATGLGALGGGARISAGGGGGFNQGFGQFTRDNAGKLTFDEARDLSRLDGVQAVDARIQGRVTLTYKGRNASTTLIGVDPSAFAQMANTDVLIGRPLNPNDAFAAVLGNAVANRTFRDEDLANRQLRVNENYSVRVVGILNASSGSLTVNDNAIYMPVSVAKTILSETEPSQFFVLARDGTDPDELAARMEERLLLLHHVMPGEQDFTITTASFIQSTVAQVTGLLSLFLGGIAAISLIVGGIGVANTMFMSVLERTKEIGILKALGMPDGQIMQLFLLEAAAIGLVGGIIGVLLSFGLSAIMGAFGVPSVITPELVAVGLLFSAGVGIASGIVPAKNAARLQPVDALRYE
ncbi:MAG: ABC transporter permease, partial [Candidatus Micrarchaeota archaeon]|nr:ABC transporter permease [Candidatus Micrarchaeota archaeon]